MCRFSGRVSFHCQNLFSSMCCSFNSLCVKFVVHEEHNVVLFQPSEKDPPQKPMTALNKPAKRPSLLPLTHRAPLNQLLSRAAGTYPAVPLPMNLSPCSAHLRQPRAGFGLRIAPRTQQCCRAPSAARSGERAQLRAPGSGRAQSPIVVY